MIWMLLKANLLFCHHSTDMKLALLLLLYAASASAFQLLSKDNNLANTCLNDGYLESEKCVCKNLVGGSLCDDWQCINYGIPISTQDGELTTCQCPRGFIGTHCEPLPCVDGVELDNSAVGNSFSLILTYNHHIQTLDTVAQDNVTQGVLKIFDSVPPSLKQLYLRIPDDPDYDTIITDTFKTNLNQNLLDYIDFFYSNSKSLTFNDIYQSIINTNSHSPILIVTDVGLKDYNDSSAYQKVLLSAVARQIEINIVVVSSMSYGYDVYHDKAYSPLINLADATLGSFISPYPALGAPFKNPASEVITKFGTLLLSKTVVTIGDVDSSGTMFNFNSQKENGDLINIAVYARDVSASNAQSTLTNVLQQQPFDLSIDAGPWKLYQTTLETVTTYVHLTTSLSKGSYKVWITTTKPQYVSLGYATNEITDAHSPLPVTGAQSTIVALGNKSLNAQNLITTVKIGNISSYSSSTSRNCLFNFKLGNIKCPKESAVGTIHIKTNNPMFETVLPVACSTTEFNQEKRSPTSISTRKYKSKKAFVETDEPLCKNNSTLGLDPTAPRTFTFAFSNTVTLANQLKNQSSFIEALQKYTNYYNSGFYATYSLFTFGDTVAEEIESTNPSNFTTSLIQAMNKPYTQNTCVSSTNQRLLLTALATKKNAFSEVFYITDSDLNIDPSDLSDLYALFSEKRIQLTFLVYSGNVCSPNTKINSTFYDLAIRTGGNVIPFSNISSITEFFNAYVGLEKSQIVVTKLNATTVLAQDTSAAFRYFPNKRYVVVGTAIRVNNNMPSKVSLISQDGTVAADVDITAKIIGDKFFIVDLPQNLTTGYYSVKLTVFGKQDGTYFNVREVWSENTDYSVIAFSNSTTEDATNAYPSFINSQYLYLVTRASQNGTISIFDADYNLIKQGDTTYRPSCSYEQILQNYTWLCTNPKGIYYLQYETSKYTHTTTFTCDSSGMDLVCQNGGTKNETGKNCLCPIGFTDSTCSTVVCFNGGQHQDDNTCKCTEYFQGRHCDKANFTCGLQPEKLHFSSAFETLIFVIDLTNVALVDAIRKDIDEFPQSFKSYVLVPANYKEEPVKILSTFSEFKSALQSLQPLNTDANAKVALKYALSAVTTQRPLLVWVSNNGFLDIKDRAEIEYLIAKTRAEVRTFVLKPTPTYLSFSVLGNGISNVVSDVNDFAKIPSYIGKITAPLNNVPQSSLVTHDYVLSNDCETINIPFNIPDSSNAYITLYNYAYDTSDSVAPNVYELSSTITINPVSGKTQCGYMIEYLSTSRIAYSLTSSKNYETEGFVVAKTDDVAILNFAAENVDPTNSDFPIASTSSLNLDRFNLIKYNFAPIISRSCTYPWGVEVQCRNETGPLKIKIQTSVNTQVLTAYCSDNVFCGSNGTKLDNGACACDPGWSGSDCRTPVCLNGGTGYKETCVCKENFSGTNCEYSSTKVEPKRNIFILLDVVNRDTSLFEMRQSLTIDFINSYKEAANYVFATNTNNVSSYRNLTTSYSSIIDAVNNVNVSDVAINLDAPLEFFEKIDLSNDSLSFVFYITHTAPQLNQSLLHVNKLKNKNVYIFSAYIIPENEIAVYDTVYENALLGGITASVSIPEIIKRFQNALQSEVLPDAITTTPIYQSTTTVIPRECVYSRQYDVVIFLNDAVSSEEQKLVKNFLTDFGNDVNFNARSFDGSRVTLGIIQSTQLPNVMCSTTNQSYFDSVNSIVFQNATSSSSLNFNQVTKVVGAVFNKNNEFTGYRNVPHVLITVSTNASVANVNDIKNKIISYNNDPTILLQSIVIGVGEGDFTDLKEISTKNGTSNNPLFLNLTNNSLLSVKHSLYSYLCDFFDTYNSETNFNCLFQSAFVKPWLVYQNY